MKDSRFFLRVFRAISIFFIVAAAFSGCNPNPETEPYYSNDLITGDYFHSIKQVNPDTSNSLHTADNTWYKDAVFYHLWVPAFADSDSNGIGDLQGILNKLDYLQNDLGVTAIWLSPIFRSNSTSSNLHGYDAIDLYTVDSRLGTNDDLKPLIQQVHSRGMRIIFDYVPNHVSNQHPWFIQSAGSTSSSYRDWFIWRNPRPSGWTGWDTYSDFHGPRNGSYYYGIFWEGMPDLNYDNPDVRDAMADVFLNWLNFGFDGMRIDAIKYLYEDWNTNGSGYADQPKTFQHWQKVRSLLDEYASVGYAKFMVAENWTSDHTNLVQYMNKDAVPGFHMTLDFPFAYAAATLDTNALNSHWQWVQSSVVPAGGWMGTFTSNHDNVVSRPMTTFSGDAAKVRLQTALQLTGPGTPFLYYGNEIGMTGAAGNDINLRQPFDWTGASTQKSDGTSLLSWHKALITLRKERASLRRGAYQLIKNQGGVFAYERSLGDERTLVVMNTGAAQASFTLTLSQVPEAVHTLFGSDDASWSGGSSATITVNNVAGYGVRVLALESGASGETLINDIPYGSGTPQSTVILMGTLSDWTSGVAMSPSSADSSILEVSRSLSGGISYQFKFKEGSDYWYGWLELSNAYDPTLVQAADISGTVIVLSQFADAGDANHNIQFTPAASTSYIFLYRPTDKHWCVVLQ